MSVLSAILFVALASADDDDPWNTGSPTWPPEPEPVPVPVPVPEPVPLPPPPAPAPMAVSLNQCHQPRRGPGVGPVFSDVAIAGQAGLAGTVGTSASGTGGGGVGVQFKVDCTRMSLSLGVGNIVAVEGDGAADFSRAVLGLTADSAVLAWRSRTDVGRGHGTHGGAAFDMALFATMSSWTDSRDAIADATGAANGDVWIVAAELGFDHTWNPTITTPEPMDVRITLEAGATARMLLDDPETHYAGWSLAYDGELADVIPLAGLYVRPSIRVANFEPYLDVSWLFGEDIPGLSGLRLVAGTRIDGSIFKLGTAAAASRSGVNPERRAPTDNLL